MKTKEGVKQIRRRTLHYYLEATKKYKWHAIAGLVSTPVVVFVRTLLISYVFADMIDQISGGLAAEEIIPTLLPEALILLVSYILINGVLGWFRFFWIWKLEIKVRYDLSMQCFNAVCRQSMDFHKDRFSGSLVSQTNKFIDAYESLFDTLVFDIIYLLSTVGLVSAILLPRAPFFVLGLIIFVVSYTIFSAFSYRKTTELSRQTADAESRRTGQLADAMSNILSVKSYARESHETRRYSDYGLDVQKAEYNHMGASMRRDIVFNIVNISIVGLIITFLLTGVPVFGLPISTLVLIVNYSITIMNEMWSINSIFRRINRSFGDAYEMTRILDLPNTIQDKKHAKELQIKQGGIEVEQIEFRHADANESIFDGLSLSIRPGERVGLVGLSGSGKTTLTKLLLRFADVKSGKILIDGQDIRNVSQESLRSAIAYVPQETALFNRSVAENIAYGRPDATRQQIEHAAKLANAHKFIQQLPNGYETMIGERGTKLSGGQRQRIAIARAIIKDAPILVLDEATSALDSESEAMIQDALLRLMRDRTSIVVAHRLSTIASLDRIIVIDNGRIVEQGSHAELLKIEGGAYRALWERQSGGNLYE